MTGDAQRPATQSAGRPLLCRLGLHHFADFPDPNPETRGLEQQGYRACTRCSKEVDSKFWEPRSARQFWLD
jgi:hypothetical protein